MEQAWVDGRAGTEREAPAGGPAERVWRTMRVLAAVSGLVLIAVVLRDSFETIVLPRRVTGRLRLARLFLGGLWLAWLLVEKLLRVSPGAAAGTCYCQPNRHLACP